MSEGGAVQDTFARLFEAQYVDYSDDLPFWINQARLWGAPILELGCGTGRIVRALAAAGFQVHGIDHNPCMLQRAKKELYPEFEGLVTLELSDIRYITLEKTFRLAILACNTFAEMEDRAAREVLLNLHKLLRPTGAVILDSPNPPEAISSIPEKDELLQSFLEPESGNYVHVFARQTIVSDKGQIHVLWRYDEMHPEGTVDCHEFSTTYHLRHSQDMISLLEEAGFSRVYFLGDYQQSALTTSSPRMITVASTT
jgi:SAM-dependent methyltransferase